MEFIIENWYIIIAAAALLIVAGVAVYRFLHIPTEEQLANAREWLLWAVIGAEKELGGGTGSIKLRQVYDLFVTRFPWLVKVITFDQFSEMVDDALVAMREMLKKNEAARALVKGEGGQE